jgi:tetratricopeptide (TPR) repeat protein
MLAGLGARGEDAAPYYRIAPRWLEQLKQETGWYDWQKLDSNLDPATRTMTALGAVSQRYYTTPEADRGLSPPDAIKQMVGYVVFSIAISVRLLDLELMASLPVLLEPFAALNPMVAAMLANARGTLLNGMSKREAARETFLNVLAQLEAISGTELAYVDMVRAAIHQTLAEIDASLGVRSFFVERLDHDTLDPNQEVGALYMKKVAALHQGDWEAAERHRQEAELAMLQSKTRPMFSTLGQELEAHAMARDLTGLKQVRAGIAAMAAEYPGWVPVMHVADAHYLRLCGDTEGALEAVRAARALDARESLRSPWIVQAATLEASLLTDLGQAAEAISLGERWLAECERDGMRYLARGLACAVAEAESKLQRFDAAMTRVSAVIAEQLALGVTGLHLGRCYELAARIALSSGDANGFARYAALTAEQYRPGKSSVLGALYERLMDEARQAGMAPSSPRETLPPDARDTSNLRDRATTVIAGCNDREERVRRALDLLCEGDPPSRGHLFLTTEGGIELAASNMVPEGITELLAFARGRIAMETTSVNTVTAAFEVQSTGYTWRSAEGAAYDAVLLAAPLSDGLRLAGVAMLVHDECRAREGFGDLAEAVARALLESGDAVGVRAA